MLFSLFILFASFSSHSLLYYAHDYWTLADHQVHVLLLENMTTVSNPIMGASPFLLLAVDLADGTTSWVMTLPNYVPSLPYLPSCEMSWDMST
jgi:hypothetical protein